MSLAQGLKLQLDQQAFTGYSIAGQTTSIYHNNSRTCFDIGQGLPFHLGAKAYCLSHLHADHGSGLHYVLSQRCLFRQAKVPIFLPAQHLKSVKAIVALWEGIEGLQYDYELYGVESGFEMEIDKGRVLRAYPTPHRLTSFGYILYEKKKKLKPEFARLPGQALAQARRQGETLETDELSPLVAYTGDTCIEFIESHPEFGESPILFLEATYLDDKKSVAETRRWGHTHLDEIIARQSLFKNKHLCLIHLSARYSTKEARKVLQEKIPPELSERVSLFPRPF